MLSAAHTIEKYLIQKDRNPSITVSQFHGEHVHAEAQSTAGRRLGPREDVGFHPGLAGVDIAIWGGEVGWDRMALSSCMRRTVGLALFFLGILAGPLSLCLGGGWKG